MLLQNGVLVFFAFTIVVVVVNAGIMTYSRNDPILKHSSIVTSADHAGTIPLNIYSTRQPIKDIGVLLKILEQLNKNELQKRNVEHMPVARQRPRERLFVEITDGLGGAAIYRHAAYSATAINKPIENTFINSDKYITFNSKPKDSTFVNVGFIGNSQLTDDAPKHTFVNLPSSVTMDTDDADSSVCSSSYQQRPDDDRKCQFGFRCMYGTCSSYLSSKQITFQCKCDPGATGLFCEQKCCLNCGQNGQCDVKPNGTQFCFCRRGYSGEKCEIE